MVSEKFTSMASYKIIDHLYDDRKDFIILGLCGKTGSGVSTVAGILEMSCEELNLAAPPYEESPKGLTADSESERFANHEYRIICNYISKNWTPFHKIKTSALITRYILDHSVEDFMRFIQGLVKDERILEEIRTIAGEFFTKEMEFDQTLYGMNYSEEDLKTLCTNMGLVPRISSDAKRCCFRNDELAGLMKKYAEYRRRKGSFEDIGFVILKQYLYEFLPRVSSEFWGAIRELSKGLATLALQCLGNNLRLNKHPYLTCGSEEFSVAADGYARIAEQINLTIKVLRACQLVHRNRVNGDPNSNQASPPAIRTIIVIDSIKNPYESQYLKARYSNYYLMGIYTEDSERHRRLRDRERIDGDDITAIDIIEDNARFNKAIKLKVGSVPKIIQKIREQYQALGLLDNLAYISPFVLQNVSSCLDHADILINNVRSNNLYTNLKRTLLRYACLIMNPGLVLPTPVERCMQIAYTAKLNSGCISRQVGAVVTDSSFHLLSVGWNQQPEGQIPCSYRNLCEVYNRWDPPAYSEYEIDTEDEFHKAIKDQVQYFFDTPDSVLAEKGKMPCYCFKDYQNAIDQERNQVHTRALHGEETAFLNLGSNKDKLVNGILFTTSSPCELCAKKAKYLGISTIYYVEPYAGVSQKHVLNIGRTRPDMILFTGAIGVAYTKLYTPLLPAKNENEMWLGEKMNTDLYESLRKHGKVNHERRGPHGAGK